jgi:hypothetical protein
VPPTATSTSVPTFTPTIAPTATGPFTYGDRWDWRTVLSTNTAGAGATIPVGFTNTSTSVWQATGANKTEIGYYWIDANHNVVQPQATAHTALPYDVQPGVSASALVQLVNPPSAGNYTLRIDLIRNWTWFMVGNQNLLPLDIGVPIT